MAKFISDEDMEKMEAAAPSPKKGFISDEEMNALESSPSRSPITAATTGLMEGAVPFAGALAGIGKAGMDAITGVRGPLAGGSIDDVVDDYRHARDEFTGDAKKARDAHPGIALTGNVVGGFANPLFKGADTLPKAMGAAAIQGLGMSDADLTTGDMKGAAIDAGVGAAGGALGYGIGKAIPKMWEGVKYFGKKGLTNFGITGEGIDARLARKAQDSARSYPELAEDLATAHKTLGEQTRALDEQAWSTLSKDSNIEKGALPKEYLLKSVDDAIEKLKTDGHLVGSSDKSANAALNSIREDLSQYGNAVSESNLKRIIQSISRDIDYNDPTKDISNKLLTEVRHGLDETLKFRNPQYKKAMLPVAERTNNLEEIERLFNLQRGKPSDTTANKIQSSTKENKAVTQKHLDKFKEFTNQDIEGSANDYRLSQQFQVKSPQASTKKSFIGGALGSLVGSAISPGLGTAVGGGIGAAAGGTMDAYGGRVAAKLIDSYLKAGNSAAFGKFAPVIEKAAAKGPEALAMLASILGSNPEFQKEMGIPDEEPPARRVLSGK